MFFGDASTKEKSVEHEMKWKKIMSLVDIEDVEANNKQNKLRNQCSLPTQKMNYHKRGKSR